MLVTDLEKQVSAASWTLGNVVFDFILAVECAICAWIGYAFAAPGFGWVSPVIAFASGCLLTMGIAKNTMRAMVRAMLRRQA